MRRKAYLALLLATAAFAADRRIRFAPGHTSAEVKDRFSTKIHERTFVIRANSGQHMRVEIKPLAAKLFTMGTVESPAGKYDGGPGGLVFDSDLSETGDYRIRVGERQSRVAGEFLVRVEIK